MKILSIIGNRPQFIKCAPFSRAVNISNNEKINPKIEHIIIHTGQHYDKKMSDLFFDELRIPIPNFFLNVGSMSHAAQTGIMLQKIEEILNKEKPDVVIVYGDTNSTLAGALSAVKIGIPVAHIEAGLRCYNRNMPEEINRVITDVISNILFCPTEISVNNLKKENITANVFLVGDIMVDSLGMIIDKSENENIFLRKHSISPRSYVLATVHRAENTDVKDNFLEIISAFQTLAINGEKIIFPVHPRTQKVLDTMNLNIHPNLVCLEPVSYIEMIYLLKNSKTLLTDSGGMQKEAYILNVPCLTLRNETEWIETLSDNANTLCGSNHKKIINIFYNLNNIETLYKKDLYGDGRTAFKIINYLKEIIG